jgi:hypothetical protein
VPTAYLSPSQLRDLTDVSVNPGAPQDGYPLVWDNDLGKWVISTLPYSSLTGTPTLGTMASQNASAVAVTGGSASGLSSLAVSGTTASTSTTTGALRVAGGVGIAGGLHAGSITVQTGNTLVVSTPNATDGEYAVFGCLITGDVFVRIAFGTDIGQPFLGFGGGQGLRDVFLRRQSPNVLRMAGNAAGTVSATFDLIGSLQLTGTFRISNSSPPTASNSSGSSGQIAWDADYIYVCTATNTWKRVAISTW